MKLNMIINDELMQQAKSVAGGKEKIDLAQFSFAQSRAILRELKGSLSDVLVAERRNAV